MIKISICTENYENGSLCNLQVSIQHLISILNNIIHNPIIEDKIEGTIITESHYIFITLELLKNYIINDKKFYLFVSMDGNRCPKIYIIDDTHPGLD
jgi:hypothetical protein